MRRIYWILSLLLFVLLIGVSVGTATTDDTPDMLVYSTYTYGEGSTLNLYNPATNEHTLLYEGVDRIYFDFSSDGRIAFSLWSKEDDGLYILDTNVPEQPLINLTEVFGLVKVLHLGWSPDSRYLVFTVVEPDNSRSLNLWDGEQIFNITPQNLPATPESYSIAWSPDGRLAISVGFGYLRGSHPSEIYLWDGRSAVNLSQNSEAQDHRMAWSEDGELAFISNNRLLVWDGVSMTDGVPDVDTFIDIGSEFDLRRAYPTWTPDGHLSFIAQSLKHSFRYFVIYEWDGSTTTVISPTASDHYTNFAWSDDGYLASVMNMETLSVQAPDNQIVHEAYVMQGIAWSTNGYLVYCDAGLTLWNRETLIEIITGDYVIAKWQSGQVAGCLVG